MSSVRVVPWIWTALWNKKDLFFDSVNSPLNLLKSSSLVVRIFPLQLVSGSRHCKSFLVMLRASREVMFMARNTLTTCRQVQSITVDSTETLKEERSLLSVHIVAV